MSFRERLAQACGRASKYLRQKLFQPISYAVKRSETGAIRRHVTCIRLSGVLVSINQQYFSLTPQNPDVIVCSTNRIAVIINDGSARLRPHLAAPLQPMAR